MRVRQRPRRPWHLRSAAGTAIRPRAPVTRSLWSADGECPDSVARLIARVFSPGCIDSDSWLIFTLALLSSTPAPQLAAAAATSHAAWAEQF